MRYFRVEDINKRESILVDPLSHEKFILDSVLLPEHTEKGTPLIFHIKENEDDRRFEHFYKSILIPYEEGPDRYAAYVGEKLTAIDASMLPEVKGLPCVLHIAINEKAINKLCELFEILIKALKEERNGNDEQ